MTEISERDCIFTLSAVLRGLENRDTSQDDMWIAKGKDFIGVLCAINEDTEPEPCLIIARPEINYVEELPETVDATIEEIKDAGCLVYVNQETHQTRCFWEHEGVVKSATVDYEPVEINHSLEGVE